ncbi:hypothetical protein NXV73_22405 [Bacteroides salyersiae]|nr:hypothetical protein [Bacteroides salyersiae]
MSLYRQHQDERWLKYTEDWGNHHGWKASEKKQERHADFQCCGQGVSGYVYAQSGADCEKNPY